MIPTCPDSKPIVCSSDEEALAVAYSILRQARHYFRQLDPDPAILDDLRGAVRDFCVNYEQRISRTPTAGTAETTTDTASNA